MSNEIYGLNKEKLVHPTFEHLFPDFDSFNYFVNNEILARYFKTDLNPNDLPDYLNERKMIYDYNVIYWSLFNRYSDWTAVNNEKKTKQLFANALVQLLPNLYLKSQSLSPELLRKITEEKEELLNVSLIKENIDPESNFIESMDQTSSTPNDPEQMLKYGRDLLNAREFNKSRTIDKTKTKRTHINVLERYNRLVYLSASNVLSMFVNSIEINSLFVYIDGNSYSRYYMVGNRGKRGEQGIPGRPGADGSNGDDGLPGISKVSIMTNQGTETDPKWVEKENRLVDYPLEWELRTSTADIDIVGDTPPYKLVMTVNDGKRGFRGEKGDQGFRGKPGFDTINTLGGTTEINNLTEKPVIFNILGNAKSNVKETEKDKQIFLEVDNGDPGFKSIKLEGKLVPGSDSEISEKDMPDGGINLVVNGTSKKGLSMKDDDDDTLTLTINDGEPAWNSIELHGQVDGGNVKIEGDQIPDNGLNLIIKGTAYKKLIGVKDDDDTLVLTINDGKDADIKIYDDEKLIKRSESHKLNLKFKGNAKRKIETIENVNDTVELYINDGKDGYNAIEKYVIEGEEFDPTQIKTLDISGSLVETGKVENGVLKLTINKPKTTFEDKDGNLVLDENTIIRWVYGNEIDDDDIKLALPFKFDKVDTVDGTPDIDVNYDLDLNDKKIKLGKVRLNEKYFNDLETNITNIKTDKQDKVFVKVKNKEYEGGEALSWSPDNHLDMNNKKIYRLIVDKRYETSAANLQYVDHKVKENTFFQKFPSTDKNDKYQDLKLIEEANFSLDKHRLKEVGDPINDSDGVNFKTVKDQININKIWGVDSSNVVKLIKDGIKGVSLDKKQLKEVANPIEGTDATNKNYVEQRLTSELAKKQNKLISDNGVWDKNISVLNMNNQNIENIKVLSFNGAVSFWSDNEHPYSFNDGKLSGVDRIVGLKDPVDNKDAVNKNYVDDRINVLKRDITRLDNRMNTEIDKTWKDGEYQLSKKLNMKSKVIEYMATGSSGDESTRKDYIDGKIQELLNKISNLESKLNNKQDKMFRKNGDTWELID